MNYSFLVRQLSVSLLAGPWQKDAMANRVAETFGKRRPWIDALVQRVLTKFGESLAPESERLLQFLRIDDAFFLAAMRQRLKVVRVLLTTAPMSKSISPPSGWAVTPLVTDSDFRHWLDISSEHLDWLADVHGRERARNRGPLRNYYYKWVKKRSGGRRLLEIPKSKLKGIQRRILTDILNKVPPHPSAHGFVKSGSIMKFVQPHCGHEMLLRMDLKDFFLSIQASRIHAMFRSLGYPERSARLLAGFCTNSVPTPVLSYPSRLDRIPPHSEIYFRTPHLPQGAPTSPALANLCAYKLDVRLSALAKRFGWNYTRYADDLLFSGPRSTSKFLQQFQIWAGAIAIEENFHINMRKTRVMNRSVPQLAAGLVLNEKPNISRIEFDALKATLHNCAKFGPAEQNRENRENFREHLLGRITYLAQFNAARGRRLKSIFDRIQWNAQA